MSIEDEPSSIEDEQTAIESEQTEIEVNPTSIEEKGRDMEVKLLRFFGYVAAQVGSKCMVVDTHSSMVFGQYFCGGGYFC